MDFVDETRKFAFDATDSKPEQHEFLAFNVRKLSKAQKRGCDASCIDGDVVLVDPW